MERCLDCNSLLTKEETVCVECGSAVPDSQRKNPANWFSTVIKILFYLSLASMFAAIFFTDGPPLIMSVLLTCALLFAMRSSGDAVVAKLKKR